MALRKASCYSKRKTVPYTRKSKLKKKSYIRTIPNTKIVKLRMGDIEGYNKGKYKTVIRIISKENVQMRDTSIEASRQYLNRNLTKIANKDFYLELKPYPHHILRENKMLTGAGADRMSTGMALSFGRTMNRAALVKKGETIYIIGINGQKTEQLLRKLIGSIKAKLPCTISVQTEYKK
jgi:large subunit ribosomal protein L10e